MVKYGDVTLLIQGNTQKGTQWIQSAGDGSPIVIGVSPIIFNEFSSQKVYTAGNGLQVVADQFSLISPVIVSNGGTGLTSLSTNSLLYGNGTNALNTLAPISNSVLTSTNSGTPQWTAFSSATPQNPSFVFYNGTIQSASQINTSYLTDISATTPTTNQILKFNGSIYVPTNYDIGSLTNVQLTSPISTNILQYNGTKWVNVASNTLPYL
jgi:hypothetical protein